MIDGARPGHRVIGREVFVERPRQSQARPAVFADSAFKRVAQPLPASGARRLEKGREKLIREGTPNRHDALLARRSLGEGGMARWPVGPMACLRDVWEFVARGAAPEPVEAVEVAGVFREDVDHEVEVVEQYPLGAGVALHQ